MCCIMGYAGHDLPKETFTEYLLRTTSRGPDDTARCAETELRPAGLRPAGHHGPVRRKACSPSSAVRDCVACNGELYGFRPVKAELEAEGLHLCSPTPTARSSCPCTTKYGLDMFKHLDAEFAMILYDSRDKLPRRRPRPHRHPPAVLRLSARAAISPSPARPKTSLGCAKRSIRFPIGSYYCRRPVCPLLRHRRYPGRTARTTLPEILHEHPRKAGGGRG